ncbi:hypothetical protein F4780DRAFT_263266 [Xylariomycetidae sp. FL0641]|nr:hypothetical protein F4780DRAFT_263266 [Xylariomycetidae sp. FL0641]
MGNSHGKEARSGGRHGAHGPGADGPGGVPTTYHGENSERLRRANRNDVSGLGLPFGASSSSRHHDGPPERRETKQEREARRLERERVARIKERERSMKEEHVDGGFLVTMGVYTAAEDFSKPVVRQLQIERKIAPFWRGLDDFNEDWAEHQIVAAARGLEIPPADEVPEGLLPQAKPTTDSTGSSAQNINSLTVPLGPRTLSASSDNTASNPGSALPSPTSPTAPKSGSLKPHKKALAAALNLSRNGSSTDMGPREVHLPHDPFVNGQPIEVYLYKEGLECPLCLMYYPPFLNKTRCCCQIICSECFVQIKRPEPHHPEHHVEENNGEGAAGNDRAAEEEKEDLVMEPAKCPYCTQTEFGVTYEAPPFRRGLVYAMNPPTVGTMSTAMSSSSSLNPPLSPTTGSNVNRKRAQSLSASAPGVISTDRIRPDWTAKLAAARAHQRRRAAAADALHHAAFVMGNQESRTIFGRSSRFVRRNTGNLRGGDSPGGSSQGQEAQDNAAGPEPGPRTSSGRTGGGRERIDAAHLESLMMAEAIRLSLADEEERQKKADKEARKDAKKKEKEDRKAAKKNKKGDVYGGSGIGASASTLSLGFGRRRGNSVASNLRMEPVSAAGESSNRSREPTTPPESTSPGTAPGDKGKAVDRGPDESQNGESSTTPSLPIPSPSQASRGASHLRQMSNASTVSTASGMDSVSGSYTGKSAAAPEDPKASGLSLGAQSEEGEQQDAEPMFNFRSLAEMVGVPIDGEEEEGVESGQQSPRRQQQDEKAHGEHVEHVEHAPEPKSSSTPVEESKEEELDEKREKLPKLETGESAVSAREESKEDKPSPPHLMVTPETPATDPEESKGADHFERADRVHEVTQ